MEKVTNSTQYFFVDNNTRYVFIEGETNTTLEKCYATLQKQLSIPEYFGNNLDALEEIINDLEWIEEKQIVVIISATDLLLSDDESRKNDFLEILETSSLENFSLVYLKD